MLKYLRRFYWRRIRRYPAEICQACGRPVRVVWWCHDDYLWNRVTGQRKPLGREPAGGIRCISCFDAELQEVTDTWVEWAPLNLRRLGDYDG